MRETSYQFGRFTLDVSRGQLFGPDGEIALRPKSFALLHLLVRNSNRLVGHDEIARVVWPQTTATDESIVQCIRDIRRALRADSATLVRTLPRRGYMLTSSMPRTETRDRPMLAVLPLAAASTAVAGSLAECLADEMITELIGSRTILVAAGPDIETRYRLSGSLRTEGRRVLIHIRLIDQSLSAHIWSARFDRESDGFAASQSSLAREIARAAEQAIAVAERGYSLRGAVEPLGAWPLYQRELRHSWRSTPADNAEAQRLFGWVSNRT